MPAVCKRFVSGELERYSRGKSSNQVTNGRKKKLWFGPVNVVKKTQNKLKAKTRLHQDKDEWGFTFNRVVICNKSLCVLPT